MSGTIFAVCVCVSVSIHLLRRVLLPVPLCALCKLHKICDTLRFQSQSANCVRLGAWTVYVFISVCDTEKGAKNFRRTVSLYCMKPGTRYTVHSMRCLCGSLMHIAFIECEAWTLERHSRWTICDSVTAFGSLFINDRLQLNCKRIAENKRNMNISDIYFEPLCTVVLMRTRVYGLTGALIRSLRWWFDKTEAQTQWIEISFELDF